MERGVREEGQEAWVMPQQNRSIHWSHGRLCSLVVLQKWLRKSFIFLFQSVTSWQEISYLRKEEASFHPWRTKQSNEPPATASFPPERMCSLIPHRGGAPQGHCIPRHHAVWHGGVSVCVCCTSLSDGLWNCKCLEQKSAILLTFLKV